MNRYLAQEKQVFDESKFTVVGSPTITSDGVASGFSDSNYLTVNMTASFNNNYNFEIDSKVKYTVSDVTQEIWNIFWTFRCRIEYSNNKHLLRFFTPVSTSSAYITIVADLDEYNFIDGDDLYIKCVSENASLRKLLFSKDGINWHIVTSNVTTDYNMSNFRSAKIGVSETNHSSFLGSIDLTKFKITVDGQTVFTGTKPVHLLERRKEGFDLSKFTVVGNPTITDDGVYSNGSSTSFLTIPNSIVKQMEGQKSWKVTFKGVMPTAINASNITGLTASNLATGGGFNIGSINGSGNFFLQFYDENGTAHPVYIASGVGYNLGKPYIGYVSFDGNQTYTVALSFDNGETWQTKIGTFTETVYFGEMNLRVGYNYSSGSLDLPQFSITVDGKEVFTGAKENYYVLRS